MSNGKVRFTVWYYQMVETEEGGYAARNAIGVEIHRSTYAAKLRRACEEQLVAHGVVGATIEKIEYNVRANDDAR